VSDPVSAYLGAFCPLRDWWRVRHAYAREDERALECIMAVERGDPVMRKEVIGGKRVSFYEAPRTVTVYAISNPAGEPVYVGSTTQALRLRIQAHIRDARIGSPTPIHDWIRAVHDFDVIVLEKDIPESARAIREQYWVSQYSGLLNSTDGGPGGSGSEWSAERKERLAAAIRTGASFPCQQCGAQFWRKQKEIRLGQNKFCSRKCYALSLKGVAREVPEHVRKRAVEAAAKARRARPNCINGHEFSAENTRINKNGARVCRACERAYRRSARLEAVNA
jgi:hypothetical protein